MEEVLVIWCVGIVVDYVDDGGGCVWVWVGC